jgi:hypothetical protein
MEEKRFVVYTVLDEVYIVDNLIVDKIGRTVSFTEDESLVTLSFDDISQVHTERVIREELVLEENEMALFV